VITANAVIGRRWAPHVTAILAGFTAGATFLLGAFELTGPVSGPRNPAGVDIGYMVTGLIAATFVSKPVRERLSRYLPINPDNPVHSLALVLAVILFGTQVSAIAFTDVLAADLKVPALTIADLVAQEAPFAVLAFAGVGLYIRRSFTASSDRLGLVTRVVPRADPSSPINGQAPPNPRAPSPARRKPMPNKTIDKYRPKKTDE